jgi:hypothetical protein
MVRRGSPVRVRKHPGLIWAIETSTLRDIPSLLVVYRALVLLAAVVAGSQLALHLTRMKPGSQVVSMISPYELSVNDGDVVMDRSFRATEAVGV